jgi:hypothetical protein
MWRGRPRARAFPMNNGRGRPFYNPASGENIEISLVQLTVLPEPGTMRSRSADQTERKARSRPGASDNLF